MQQNSFLSPGHKSNRFSQNSYNEPYSASPHQRVMPKPIKSPYQSHSRLPMVHKALDRQTLKEMLDSEFAKSKGRIENTFRDVSFYKDRIKQFTPKETDFTTLLQPEIKYQLPTQISHLRKLYENSDYKNFPRAFTANGAATLAQCKKSQCVEKVEMNRDRSGINRSVESLQKLDKNFLGSPTGRQDILNLMEWFEQMCSRFVPDFNETDMQEIEEDVLGNASLIYSMCGRELVRQISTQCNQRGALLEELLKRWVKLQNIQHQKVVYDKNMLIKNHKKEMQKQRDGWMGKVEEAYKEIQQQKETISQQQRNIKYNKELLEILQSRYDDTYSQLRTIKEEIREKALQKYNNRNQNVIKHVNAEQIDSVSSDSGYEVGAPTITIWETQEQQDEGIDINPIGDFWVDIGVQITAEVNEVEVQTELDTFDKEISITPYELIELQSENFGLYIEAPAEYIQEVLTQDSLQQDTSDDEDLDQELNDVAPEDIIEELEDSEEEEFGEVLKSTTQPAMMLSSLDFLQFNSSKPISKLPSRTYNLKSKMKYRYDTLKLLNQELLKKREQLAQVKQKIINSKSKIQRSNSLTSSSKSPKRRRGDETPWSPDSTPALRFSSLYISEEDMPIDPALLQLIPQTGIHRPSWQAGYNVGLEAGKRMGFSEGEALGLEQGRMQQIQQQYFTQENQLEPEDNHFSEDEDMYTPDINVLSDQVSDFTDEMRSSGGNLPRSKNKKSRLPKKRIRDVTKFMEFHFYRRGEVMKQRKEHPVSKFWESIMSKRVNYLVSKCTMSSRLVYRTISSFLNICLQKLIQQEPIDLHEVLYDDFLAKYGLKRVAERKFIEFIGSLFKYYRTRRALVFLKFLGAAGKVGYRNYSTYSFTLYLNLLKYMLTSKIGIVINHDDSDEVQYFPTNRALEYTKEKLSDIKERAYLDTILQGINKSSIPDPKKINGGGLIELELFLELVIDQFETFQSDIKEGIELLIGAIRLGENADGMLKLELEMLIQQLHPNKLRNVIKYSEEDEGLIIDEWVELDTLIQVALDMGLFSLAVIQRVYGTFPEVEDAEAEKLIQDQIRQLKEKASSDYMRNKLTNLRREKQDFEVVWLASQIYMKALQGSQ